MKTVQIGPAVLRVPDELEPKVRRLQAEYPILQLPDCPWPRSVLDVGCGPGAFIVLATLAFDWPWTIGYDVHPVLTELALGGNVPPWCGVVNAAVSAEEAGKPCAVCGGVGKVEKPVDAGEGAADAEAEGVTIADRCDACRGTGQGHCVLMGRGEARTPVKILHPSELPPCDCVHLNIGGHENGFIESYPYWDGVRWAYVEWHHEVKASENVGVNAGRILLAGYGLRLFRALSYGPDRHVDLWARSRAVWDKKCGRFAMPRAGTIAAEVP